MPSAGSTDIATMAINTVDKSRTRARAFDVSTETGIEIADPSDANNIVGAILLLKDSSGNILGCNEIERSGNTYGRVVT